MVKVQIALDQIVLSRAIKIAGEALEAGINWIEVGTPLIKSEGVNSIEIFKKEFPNHRIVADMKTIDTGDLEVEIAAKKGADVVTVLGSASDTTIKEAIKSGKKYNAEIMADLVNMEGEKCVKRAKKLESIGVDYILVHTGIDDQMAGANPLDSLKLISKTVDIPVAVAGGIDKNSACEALKFGADLIIIGGAITRSKDVFKASREIIGKIEEFKKNNRDNTDFVNTPKTEDFKITEKISSANLSDALNGKGVIQGLKKVSGKNEKIFGKVFTVKTIPGDWAKPVEAIKEAEKEDIIFIDAGGKRLAVWGGLATKSALEKGIRGVIVDGAVRDITEIKKMDFPVWCKYTSPEAKEPKGYGDIGGEINCGNVRIEKGDYVFADENGIIALKKENIDEVLNRAKMIHENEKRIEKEITKENTLTDVLNLGEWEQSGK